jgi:plasmid replication initiation protein
VPDCFYAGVLQEVLVLTIDRAYFDLTGGLERWLYRLARKHGGRQEGAAGVLASNTFTPSPAASRR